MSTPILRLKGKKNVPYAARSGKSFSTLAPPPKYVFETGLFFDWLSSLMAVFSLAGFASVDERRSTLFSCNTYPRMSSKRKVEDVRCYLFRDLSRAVSLLIVSKFYLAGDRGTPARSYLIEGRFRTAGFFFCISLLLIMFHLIHIYNTFFNNLKTLNIQHSSQSQAW